MSRQDTQAGRAFRPRGADEILPHDFQHPAAREPRDVGGEVEAQRERGQHAVAGRVPAGGVEPAELEREEEHHHRPEHERGQAHADHRGGHRHVVLRGVGLLRSKHSGGQADGQRDEQRPRAQLQRHGERLADDFADGAVRVADGRLLSGDEGLEEVDVLHAERFIQAVVRLQSFENLRRDVALGGERPARRVAHHEEGERGHRPEDRERLQQADEEEAEHQAGRREASNGVNTEEARKNGRSGEACSVFNRFFIRGKNPPPDLGGYSKERCL